MDCDHDAASSDVVKEDGEKSFMEVTTFQSCWFLFGFKFDVLIFLTGGAKIHRLGVSLCGVRAWR